eukprot:744067-Pelagomonas_calceolata.AAC.2
MPFKSLASKHVKFLLLLKPPASKLPFTCRVLRLQGLAFTHLLIVSTSPKYLLQDDYRFYMLLSMCRQPAFPTVRSTSCPKFEAKGCAGAQQKQRIHGALYCRMQDTVNAAQGIICICNDKSLSFVGALFATTHQPRTSKMNILRYWASIMKGLLPPKCARSTN